MALRLFLPDAWAHDPERCARAGIPEAACVVRAKGEIALAEIDRVLAAGIRFGMALADTGYGASAEFRQGLDARGLAWAVGIPRNQKVYGTGVQLVPPAGRKRRPVPDEKPREAAAVLGGLRWRRAAWRRGTKGTLAARFAAARVCVGDGPTFANNQHLPGREAWLVGKWRASGERKFYLSNLPPATPLRALAAAIKARWVCEQAHQQRKQELGLGHFEGRSWTGLHRHALMSCIAFAYLQHLRLAEARRTARGKRRRAPGPPPSPSLPAVRRVVMARLFAGLATAIRCPHCDHQFMRLLIRKCPGGARCPVYTASDRCWTGPYPSSPRRVFVFCRCSMT